MVFAGTGCWLTSKVQQGSGWDFSNPQKRAHVGQRGRLEDVGTVYWGVCEDEALTDAGGVSVAPFRPFNAGHPGCSRFPWMAEHLNRLPPHMKSVYRGFDIVEVKINSQDEERMFEHYPSVFVWELGLVLRNGVTLKVEVIRRQGHTLPLPMNCHTFALGEALGWFKLYPEPKDMWFLHPEPKGMWFLRHMWLNQPQEAEALIQHCSDSSTQIQEPSKENLEAAVAGLENGRYLVVMYGTGEEQQLLPVHSGFLDVFDAGKKDGFRYADSPGEYLPTFKTLTEVAERYVKYETEHGYAMKYMDIRVVK